MTPHYTRRFVRFWNVNPWHAYLAGGPWVIDYHWAAISFAIGAGMKSPAQASGLALLLALTRAPLGGAWWPMDISPRFLQIIGHVSPIAWAMDGFTALTYRGAHPADIWLPLAVLIVMTAVLFVIAIPLFRYQVD